MAVKESPSHEVCRHIKSVHSWCDDRPWFFHIKIGVRHLLRVSRKTRMLHGIRIWSLLPYFICDDHIVCLVTKIVSNAIELNIWLEKNPRRCHNVPEWSRLATPGWFRPELGAIWLCQHECGATLITYVPNSFHTLLKEEIDPLFKAFGRVLHIMSVTQTRVVKRDTLTSKKSWCGECT